MTNWPIIPGSAFKGVWADHYKASEDNRRSNRELRLAFGLSSDESQDTSNAGALIPTDARLVCLPVRSFQGTFAWCTSALAVRMLRRDLDLIGEKEPPPDLVGPESDMAFHTEKSNLIEDGRIYLEDLDLAAVKGDATTRWADWITNRVFPGDKGW